MFLSEQSIAMLRLLILLQLKKAERTSNHGEALEVVWGADSDNKV
jgi:hypothetical protein